MDLHFDPLQYRYPSRRRLVYGRRGMSAPPNPWLPRQAWI